MYERLTFEREVRGVTVPFEHDLPAIDRELPPRSRPSAGVLVDFDKLRDYLKHKAATFPVAADAPYLAIVQRDRTWIWYRSDPEPTQYPIVLGKSTAGHYLLEWNAQGRGTKATDLDTGTTLNALPSQARFLAGAQEAAELRKRARRGVHWVQVDVADNPPADQTMPDEFPLYRSPTVSREQAARELEGPLGPLIVPYPTADVIEPHSYRPKPLNFTYYTQNGTTALVSRKLLDEDYFYRPSTAAIFEYLKFYPISQAGKAGMGFVVLYQIVGEIGIYFVPIIGPIYGLYQAGKSAHQLITNWDKMSGWEKALAMTDVVFAKFDIVKGARVALQTAKGAKVAKTGVDALTAGGLSLVEAKGLLDAASVAAKEGTKLKAVMDLAGLVRKGGRLNAQQLEQVVSFYEMLLKRLKPRDRLLAEAVHATQDLGTARKFLLETEITARQLNGLRVLDPESLVRLREAAKEAKHLVTQVADIAASSREAAAGVLTVISTTKPAHFAKVVVALGDEVLDGIGRGMAKIDPQVAAAAAKARTPAKAYRILMDGLPKLGKTGIAEQLWRRTRLPSDLTAAAARFRKRGMFLSEAQLRWFSGLTARLQDLLAAAPESDIWRIAGSAENAKALARYTDDLLAAGEKADRVLKVLDHVGLRLIARAEDLGVRLSPDLLRAASKEKDWAAAAQRILQGSGPVEGLLKHMADRIPNRTELAAAVAKAGSARTAGDLTAYWLLNQAKSLGRTFDPVQPEWFGVAAVAQARSADAREVLSKIYRSTDNPENVLKALGRVAELHKGPQGMGSIIGDLAAGGDKTAGALFVLDFAANEAKSVTHIEYRVIDSIPRGKQGRLAERQYDLVAEGIRHEMKYWSNWEGAKVKSAVDEFMRDIVQHAGDFSKLRWVFSKNMQPYESAIVESFAAAFKDRWVRDSLRKKGIEAADALANFQKMLGSGAFLIFR